MNGAMDELHKPFVADNEGQEIQPLALDDVALCREALVSILYNLFSSLSYVYTGEVF